MRLRDRASLVLSITEERLDDLARSIESHREIGNIRMVNFLHRTLDTNIMLNELATKELEKSYAWRIRQRL